MPSLFHRFIELVNDSPGDMLHTGSRKNGEESTFRKMADHFPVCRHVGTDIEPGEDVDIVADLHCLAIQRRFKYVLSCSTLEHCRKPWDVALELSWVTKPGGVIFVQTHQAFPIHMYPDDYFRFSTSALECLFGPDYGWEVIDSEYEFPCKIVPSDPIKSWNPLANGYLNVCVMSRRKES